MESIRKPIGGEFWFESELQSKKTISIASSKEILLNGGKSAIEFIMQKVDFKQDEILLLPSYLCPTIVEFIKNNNINFKFYNVNMDLSLDLDEINNLISKNKVKALFFIDYFGFYHSKNEKDKLLQLQKEGIILIEDAVQMFWVNANKGFIGDYVFNSYRKFLPIDGSIVIGINDEKIQEIEDDYYNLMKKARSEKSIFINQGIGSEDIFLDDFRKAHESYYKRDTINGINESSKDFLKHLPLEELNKKRIKNYEYLKQKLNEIQGVKIIFNEELEDNIPLCIPILVKNRDDLRKKLMKYNIYCPIHWDIRNEKWVQNYISALEISKGILSIPIDWRYDLVDMDYLLEILKKQL